jgi:hypothetical protein
MLTRQEIFDKVATHLLTQKQQSLGPDGCMYRGDNGLKCAIGVLIPDDKYSPSFEGATCYDEGANGVLMARIRQAAGIADEDGAFAFRLQRIHDSTLTDNWFVQLRQLADQFELSAAVLYGEAEGA